MLLMAQPDMGTALVTCFAIGSLLIAAGVPKENLAKIIGVLAVLALIFAVVEPYRRARLLTFLHPWQDATGDGFQSVQAMIAIGSGGFFGVGLGESVQKIFYLPEAHTDMILAVIGEEWGVMGIAGVAGLFGLLGYAGLRAAKLAKDRYAKLVAAGITGLILSQAILNFFAVMGMAPLTGVPLPFISYGSSNLIVVLAGAGILLNVAGGARVADSKSRKRPQRSREQERRSRPKRAARAA
jgi:cell division protein FtsW